MTATAIQTDLTTTKIYNVGTNQITLNSSGENYTGKYGSGTTSLIIPANTWVELFSNGTEWRVNDRSGENQFQNNLSSNFSQEQEGMVVIVFRKQWLRLGLLILPVLFFCLDDLLIFI